MQTENTMNRENPQMPPSNTLNEVQQLAGEITRIKQDVERFNSATVNELVQLETSQTEQETGLKSSKRTGRILWAAVVILAAGVIGASWYGFPLLQEHSRLLAQLPSLQDSLNSAGSRLDSAEEQLRGWTSQQDVLAGRLTKVEKRVTANLQLARKESEQLAAHFNQILQAELDKRMEPVQARLNQLESGQQAEQDRLAQLGDEVSGLRSETAQQIALARQANSRDIASVSHEVASNRRDFDDLSRRLDHDRVDFEVAKNQNHELVPGINLKVTHTNPSYQNMDGWLQLVPDAKTLWVRGQDIGQPVVFFTQRDDRPYELVLTRVTKDAVLGYLLVPAQSGNNNSISTTGNTQMSYSAVTTQ